LEKRSLADFLFVGVGVLPATLMFGGVPELGLFLFFPLFAAACCRCMEEQMQDEEERRPGDRRPGRKPGASDAPGGNRHPRA
jgi:hypothetical protein